MSDYVCIFNSVTWKANQQFYEALYYHVWFVFLYNIISHIFSQRERFSKKFTEYETKVSIFISV